MAPILGSNNLGPTQNNTKEFQPAFGFAWSPFKDHKTVIRGGAGIYWDSTPGYYKLREAASIDPPGADRNTLAASAFTNNIPGPFGGSGILNIFGPGNNPACPIPGLNCAPIPIGSPLPLASLTTMTVGQFVNLVNQELPSVAAVLSPPNPQRSGPFQYANINYAKQGVEIYPQSFPLARSYQTSLGVQRELGGGMVLTADWARRQGENVSLGEVDQNLYNRFQGSSTPVPVIPLCKTSPDYNPADECSSGSITFWNDEGRAIYEGLLVKLQKRFSHRYQFIASYALQRATTENVWDDAHYAAGYGQYLPHHNLTIAGTVNLPWGFTISMNSSFISATPGTPTVSTSSGLILPGTVPAGSSEPLPGVAYGSLNAGCDQSCLEAAVAKYNSTIVGSVNAKGQVIPVSSSIILPKSFAFGAPTISQDFRLTKIFTFKEHYKFNVFGELFNAFNISNLTGYSYALDTGTPGSVGTNFGQPTSRPGQLYGSAGPRAAQVGARFTF